jgi:hypothetical protein
MGMLVLRFPAAASLELKGDGWGVLTDKGLQAVSSLPALTKLNISWCGLVTDVGMRAVSSLPALTKLNISGCEKVSDEGASSEQQLQRTQVAQPQLLHEDHRRGAASSDKVVTES